ncbi:hypothetical protein MATL_G00245500 [Megalops atlanticus]|uniref:Fibulin C-terminal Ig-like domain-containing protein n=1 Tax=Megalops atlanticus TaxID=7932 RepID=A0A9D3T0Q8_MEGAT|nr:hypothetical protein MATL_G00245500 [Megalops atlanticus]
MSAPLRVVVHAGSLFSRKFKPLSSALSECQALIFYTVQRQRRPQDNRSDIVRCVKSCQPNDIDCILDRVHSISHTVISLPTFREEPLLEEIVFLRTVSPAQTGISDIVFEVLEGNFQDSFDVIKRYENGLIVGVVRQVKPITGPRHIVLKLAMNYVVSGVVSHRNIVNVHIFVSEFWF